MAIFSITRTRTGIRGNTLQSVTLDTRMGGAIVRSAIIGDDDMTSAIEKAGANVAPPIQGEVYRVALTASSVTYTVPTTWNTKYVTLRAVGADLQYQFGAAADTLSLTMDALSTGTPPAMVANTASGATLKDGETESFRIFGQTKFAIISAGTTGHFELWLSENTDTL